MKSVIRSIKNEINNYDEGERLVRELTSNESTPPSTQMLIKLKIMLTDQYQFLTIVRMLFKRLKDYNNIRHVEKALICIEYLIKHADRKFVRYCKVNEKSISKLMRYRYILNMQDYGHNIRKRAKRIGLLLKNDEKLRETRAQAQGYSMSFNKKNKRSKPNNYNKRNTSSSSTTTSSSKRRANGATSSSNNNYKQSSTQQKKKKTKKKKTKKPKTDKPQEPQQPQYETFIDVPEDTNNGNASQQSSQQSQQQSNDDDLLATEWWKAETEDPFEKEDDFGWYQAGDQNNEEQTGFGDDGGEFGFGGDNDFAKENKEDDGDAVADADTWMTTLTKMENVLDADIINKKDVNKRNKKGVSMAQLAKKNNVNKPIPNAFGTDDFFNQNSNATTTNNNDTFDPFGLESNQQQQQNNGGGFGHLYNQNNNNNNNNSFGSFGASSNNSFGYQAKQNVNPYGQNDPFAGIGSNKTNPSGAVGAAYVPRKKPSDPFAQFGLK